MTDDQKIDSIMHSLRNYAFEDINRASNGGSKIGAFILASCLIDALASFWSGKDSTRSTYKNFLQKYLRIYDHENLYNNLRCKLVHNYSEGGSYLFTDNHPEIHLEICDDGRIIINLENFINEIKASMEAYFTDLNTDKQLRTNAITRFHKPGIIQQLQ